VILHRIVKFRKLLLHLKKMLYLKTFSSYINEILYSYVINYCATFGHKTSRYLYSNLKCNFKVHFQLNQTPQNSTISAHFYAKYNGFKTISLSIKFLTQPYKQYFYILAIWPTSGGPRVTKIVTRHASLCPKSYGVDILSLNILVFPEPWKHRFHKSGNFNTP